MLKLNCRLYIFMVHTSFFVAADTDELFQTELCPAMDVYITR